MLASNAVWTTQRAYLALMCVRYHSIWGPLEDLSRFIDEAVIFTEDNHHYISDIHEVLTLSCLDAVVFKLPKCHIFENKIEHIDLIPIPGQLVADSINVDAIKTAFNFHK